MRTDEPIVLRPGHTHRTFPREDVADDEVPCLDVEDPLVTQFSADEGVLDEEALPKGANPDLLVARIGLHLHNTSLQLEQRADGNPLDLHGANPSISRCISS